MQKIVKTTLLLLSFIFLFSACSQMPSKGNRDGKRVPFSPIAGIDFFETRRAFASGLSFDSTGFQQEPLWHINFTNDDSVKIYSIEGDSMLHYAIYYDQDSIFHFGREWFRVKSIHKDSLLLQRLTVQSLRVKEARSDVYMKFYSKDFLENNIRKSVEELRKPSAQDTAFVKEMIRRTNDNPTNLDSLYAARNPATFKSKSANMSIREHVLEDGEGMARTAAYKYLYPEFDVEITQSYKEEGFYYSFSAFLHADGTMTVAKFITSPEFEESRRRVLQGILDVYFQNYLEITPGSTLGIPHNTLVMLHVRGIKPE